jgi:hypothetical protein
MDEEDTMEVASQLTINTKNRKVREFMIGIESPGLFSGNDLNTDVATPVLGDISKSKISSPIK